MEGEQVGGGMLRAALQFGQKGKERDMEGCNFRGWKGLLVCFNPEGNLIMSEVLGERSQ